MVWFTPAQMANMHYTKELGIKDGGMKVPPLVWKYDAYHKNLHLFAFRAEKVSDKMELFHAPFHNVYVDGSFCWGTAHKALKDNLSFQEIIDNVMNCFWNSRFSEAHNTGIYAKDYLAITQKHYIDTKKDFPLDSLKPINRKLASLWK